MDLNPEKNLNARLPDVYTVEKRKFPTKRLCRNLAKIED